MGLKLGIVDENFPAFGTLPIAGLAPAAAAAAQRQQSGTRPALGRLAAVGRLQAVRVGRAGDGRPVVTRHVLLEVARMFEGAAALGTYVDLAGVTVIHPIR